MQVSTVFAGHGGQGVMLMGYVLSYSAMAKGLNVTYIPSYGPEMRGGTANCTVTVADVKIDSPVTDEPDVIVVMNQPSVEKFAPVAAKNGLAVVNSALITPEMIANSTDRTDLNILNIDSIALANEIDAAKAANMIVIGAFAAKSGLLTYDEAVAGMKLALKGKDKFFPMNEKALAKGFEVGAG